jgi:alkanesulfonate monooxygenase SsuD/methylene tetrahydromethanopterin reductase-like flavin-dependent oxidoreductase (luciferase family)
MSMCPGKSLRLIRLLLMQERVSLSGEFFTVDGAHIGAAAGQAAGHLARRQRPGALNRVGRLAGGWLGSLLTPEEARAARETIQSAASAAGREVEADQFGISRRAGLPVAVDSGAVWPLGG